MASLLAKTPMDERIADLLTDSVELLGFRLVRVRLQGGARPTLQVMAEKADGTMEVDDCAELSHHLSAVLDVEDPIDGEYVLEVSSPGIDRPLTAPKDFARFKGFEARLETRDLIEGRKRFKGPLLGLGEDGETVRIDAENLGPTDLPFDALTDAKLVLTDALIKESLKGRKPGASAADGSEIDIDPDASEEVEISDQSAADEDAAAPEGDEDAPAADRRRAEDR